MRDTETSEDPAELAASLRTLFDSLVDLPTDDPLKAKARAFLRVIPSLLEEGQKGPAGEGGMRRPVN